MILEQVQITNNVKLFVTRICDDCNIKERARMAVVFRGRIKRGGDIDLCRKCSCSYKNKSKNSWATGENSHLWKGGLRKGKNGLRRYTGTKGKYIYEHRRIMSQMLHRELLPHEVVHHIDMDQYNNDPDNLFLFDDSSKHMLCHYSAEWLAYGFLGTYIWFDRHAKEYTTEPVAHKSDTVLDLQFLEEKRIRIFRRRLANGQFKCYQYYNEKKTTGEGYHKRYIHLEIIRKLIKRDIFRNECVHHINGNSLDNSLDNLILLTNSRHGWIHKYSLQNSVAQLYNRGVVVFDNGIYKVRT